MNTVIKSGRLRYFANRVMMVEPTNFYYNQETAQDNEFMTNLKEDDDLLEETSSKEISSLSIEHVALQQHQGLRKAIEDSGITVMNYKQQAKDLPDSLFPNNWVSVHQYPQLMDQKVVWVYPMKVPSRQREVNQQIVNDLLGDDGHCIDFTSYNLTSQVLEGTGVLIFDPLNHKIYAGISQRWELDVWEHLIEELNKKSIVPFKLVTFNAKTPNGTPIYHTNVMMSILSHHAVICLDSISDPEEKEKVVNELSSPYLNEFPRKIIDLSPDEILTMWGNILWVVDNQGKAWVIMSSTAFNGYSDENRKELESHYKIIHSDVSTIEKIGGGSARCMVAEVF